MHRFVALDSFRGILAIGVLLFHIDFHWSESRTPVISQMYVFVDFFFVLSGFVICSSMRARPDELFRSFLVKRLARLYPLHLTILGVLVAMWVFAPGLRTVETAPVAILSNLTLTHALNLHDNLTWNVPSWSISVEYWTYIMLYAALAAHLRWRAFAVISLASGIGLYCLHGKIDALYEWSILRGFYGGFLGAAAYDVFNSTGGKKLRGVWANAAEITALLAVLTFLAVEKSAAVQMLAPVLFVVVIYTFAHESGAASRYLSCRLFRSLGALSYSIYMTHWMVVIYVAPQLAHTFPALKPNLVFALTCIALTLLLSVLTYRYVEQPGVILGRRIARRLRERNIVAPVT